MGPSFAPVPAKLVGQIVSRKFVELSDLLQANIAQSESEPKLVFDSRMILTSNPKRYLARKLMTLSLGWRLSPLLQSCSLLIESLMVICCT